MSDAFHDAMGEGWVSNIQRAAELAAELSAELSAERAASSEVELDSDSIAKLLGILVATWRERATRLRKSARSAQLTARKRASSLRKSADSIMACRQELLTSVALSLVTRPFMAMTDEERKSVLLSIGIAPSSSKAASAELAMKAVKDWSCDKLGAQAAISAVSLCLLPQHEPSGEDVKHARVLAKQRGGKRGEK